MARFKGFSGKIVRDLPLDKDAGLVARFGKSAATRGADLVRELKMLLAFEEAGAAAKVFGKQKAEIDKRLADLATAIKQNDVIIFREIAEFLDAVSRYEKRGPIAEAWAIASSYVNLCQNGIRLKKTPQLLRIFAQTPTAVEALKRSPFTPTVADINRHLCAVIQSPPDYKTVLEIAKALRIRPRKKRPNSK
ncbi:MAG: hypothetical protein WCA95_05130 [Opitutaceae bacterium]